MLSHMPVMEMMYYLEFLVCYLPMSFSKVLVFGLLNMAIICTLLGFQFNLQMKISCGYAYWRIACGHAHPRLTFGHAHGKLCCGHAHPRLTFGHAHPRVTCGHAHWRITCGHAHPRLTFGHAHWKISYGHAHQTLSSRYILSNINTENLHGHAQFVLGMPISVTTRHTHGHAQVVSEVLLGHAHPAMGVAHNPNPH